MSPVQEMLSTPGPWYSTMAPVPPLTVRMPATLQMMSLGELHLDSFPVRRTPITCTRARLSDGDVRSYTYTYSQTQQLSIMIVHDIQGLPERRGQAYRVR